MSRTGFGQVSARFGNAPTWPFSERAVSEGETDVTAGETALNIVFVRYQTELLTKRRAVDFCRVATALCRVA